MRRTIGLMLALAVGLTPAWAAGGDSAPRRDRAAARAELYRDLARRLAGLDERLARADDVTYDEAILVRAGDLDGDRTDELVDIRYHYVESADGTESLSARAEVRRGRDGGLLWAREMGSADFLFPLFAKVGPNGVPGIVLVSYDVSFHDADLVFGMVEKSSVTVLDGKGALVWAKSWDGAAAFGPTSYSIKATTINGFIDAKPGGGMEVLVSTVEGTYGGDPVGVAYGGASSVQAVILDGATGTEAPLAPVASTSPAPGVTAAGDLDGDKREDVVVAGGTGPTTTATALRSSDGAVIWAAPDLPAAEESWPTGIDDATGDGVGDVTVGTSWWAAGPVGGFQDPVVSLVDGATGDLRWTKPGLLGIAVGNADKVAGAEVVVGDFVDGDDSFGIATEAFDKDGKSIWARRRMLSTTGLTSYMASASFGILGDTDADRVLDVGYALRIDGRVSRADEGVIDGRTGRARRDPGPELTMSDLAVDGRGVDLYGAKAKGGRVTVSAWRGDSGKRLWEVTLKTAGIPRRSTTAYADRDKCADVVVSVVAPNVTTDFVLSGATGRPLWALTRAGNAAGKVTRPKATAQRRFARAC